MDSCPSLTRNQKCLSLQAFFFVSILKMFLLINIVVLLHDIFRLADSKTLKQPGFKFRQMYLSKFARYLYLYSFTCMLIIVFYHTCMTYEPRIIFMD